MSDNIEIMGISKLLEKKFFIPSYQRGYRWGKTQIEDLLEDIWKFHKKDRKKGEFYCLQPIVVKKRGNKEIEWEVIDGQQRVTTLFLIVKYLEDVVKQRFLKFHSSLQLSFPSIYETRKDCENFLKDVKIKTEEDSKKNVDFYHIWQAYNTIKTWFEKIEIENEEIENGIPAQFADTLLKFTLDEQNKKVDTANNVRVIWYEIKEEETNNPIDIFTRINMGKIPLTNAELIKALFLNSSNFKNNDEEIVRLKQLEIASEWDNIEYSLHNDEFWLFLNDAENEKETRIEFIFELIVALQGSQEEVDENDEYFTFRKYYEMFKNNDEQTITDNWKYVKRCFQTLQYWFDNRELYHKIGFLISCSEKSKTLIIKLLKLVTPLKNKESEKEKKMITKTKFIEHIHNRIKNQVKDIQLSELEYEKHKTEIRNILLLHNIQTMLKNEKENSRFQFNRYKREKWDIEHINAIAEKIPESDQHKKDWLRESKEFITEENITEENKSLKEEIEKFLENFSKDKDFKTLFHKVLNLFKENEQDDVNNLSNLVLLDERTNRGYGNAIFPIKRKTIIEKEKSGTFVPLCTKNVFMKFYSSKIEQMTFWGKEDRDAYLKDIKDVLSEYFPTKKEEF